MHITCLVYQGGVRRNIDPASSRMVTTVHEDQQIDPLIWQSRSCYIMKSCAAQASTGLWNNLSNPQAMHIFLFKINKVKVP